MPKPKLNKSQERRRIIIYNTKTHCWEENELKYKLNHEYKDKALIFFPNKKGWFNLSLSSQEMKTEIKLTKVQSKRFDEFVEEHHTTTQVEPRILPEDKVKQFLAKELSIQEKESLRG